MFDTRVTRARLLLPIVVLAGSAALASCGTAAEDDSAAPSSSPEASAEANSADVMFAQMMIPHHEQAVEMSSLAESRAGDEVLDLAQRIEDAQGPEIERLTAMLETWGEPTEPEGGMDHGMDGMMSDDQMAELEAAEGEEFDTLYLELMIEHHEGAVEMAQTELESGSYPEAVEMAQEIVDAQETEIEEMRGLLGEDPSAPAEDSGSDADTGAEGGEEGGHGGH
ncbi:DUF305 domain-containing protein [Nocardiopsis mangrovi]|uniref:DUF305 domain-containing protein n=1 Tax=Nocardiopsis mangrovi TaxID=1179818 RepID=A0ABV9E2I4_9ACTN